jgi:hypothetical protein
MSWSLGGLKSSRVDLSAAVDRASFDHPDFKVREWLVSADGAAALAVSGNRHEILVVFANGDRLVTRRGAPEAFDVRFEGELVSLKVGDILSRRLKIRATDRAMASDWKSRLRFGA